MINRNESFVEKESQWYRYRFSYSNVEKCKLHLAVTQVANLMYMCAFLTRKDSLTRHIN